MISDDSAELAVDYLKDTSRAIGQARGAMEYREGSLRRIKALKMVELEMSRGIAELADGLRSRGHPIKIAPLQSGLGFLVWRDGWSGAADPRRDGNAVTGQSAGKAP